MIVLVKKLRISKYEKRREEVSFGVEQLLARGGEAGAGCASTFPQE